MFERLERVPPDPILGLMAAFRADTDPRKVDLGVGVFRNDQGETPVLAAVRQAEQAVLSRQTTKAYVGPAGNPAFNAAMEELVFGAGHPALTGGRIRTIQATGGCGSLRVGAELILTADPGAVIHVSTPTWANHVPLLTGCGLRMEHYPYSDRATGDVNFPAMLAAIDKLPARSVVLVHASCHNPTGADLSKAQWDELLEVIRKRDLVPYIDMAYQGLGVGIDEDAYGIRLFASELPELLVAVSCSKNFGLYRERTGALHIVTQTPAAAEACLTHAVRIARKLYSMPPDHGAAIVHEVLTTPALRESWLAEVASMRERISKLRKSLVAALSRACPQRDFSFIGRQYGMFSFLGVDVNQVRALREQHHIYMMDDSRMNVAGLREDSIDYFAHAVAQVLKS
jgi:aspartate aminotransferase